jgi:hypothetical protein
LSKQVALILPAARKGEDHVIPTDSARHLGGRTIPAALYTQRRRDMHVKVNLRIAEAGETTRKQGLVSESWNIGYQEPVSLSSLLVSTCCRIAEFWEEIGCGSPEELNAELHKAAKSLAALERREDKHENPH